jgi:hypothetical protein
VLKVVPSIIVRTVFYLRFVGTVLTPAPMISHETIGYPSSISYIFWASYILRITTEVESQSLNKNVQMSPRLLIQTG